MSEYCGWLPNSAGLVAVLRGSQLGVVTEKTRRGWSELANQLCDRRRLPDAS